MTNFKIRITILLLLTVALSSCTKIGEYYVGLNLQPDMDNSSFNPGLNVYGILKAGPDLDTINHYFEVQQLMDIANWSDDFVISDASIELTRITSEGETFNYSLKPTADSLYSDTTIVTAPGDYWDYVCTYDTFEVTASCIIPDYPEITAGSFEKTDQGISFTVKYNETAFMYLVYLINGENLLTEQEIPVSGTDTEFDLQPDWETEEETSSLYIFAYDQNLEEYYTTSNTFFKPNAYRPLFSTVEGGYGTFGAVSSCLVTF